MQQILDLEPLDKILLMFDRPTELRLYDRFPEDWSKRGEMTRIILGILRQATEPLTSQDIAVQLIAERALDQTDASFNG